MADTVGGYPTSPFERFTTGLSTGANSMMDLLDKAEKLKRQTQENENAKAAADLAATQAKKAAIGGDVSQAPDAPTMGTGTTTTTGSETERPGTGGGARKYLGNDSSGISGDAMHDYLINNLKATPNEAATLVSAGINESSLTPNVTHDGGIGYGLFGHNGSRLVEMRRSAGVGPNDPVPWQKQVEFALNELRSRPENQLVNSATTPEQLTAAQFKFEQPSMRNQATGGMYSNITQHPSYQSRFAATQQYMNRTPSTEPAMDTSKLAQIPEGAGAGILGAPMPATTQSAALGMGTAAGMRMPSPVYTAPALATTPAPATTAGAPPQPQAALVPQQLPQSQVAQLVPPQYAQGYPQQYALMPTNSGLWGTG